MRSQPKRDALRASGTFNPRASQVRHPLFKAGGFFDPEDLVQLKYEALRALRVDNYSVSRASLEFGLSRPTLYQSQARFEARGLEGLLPAKRGPKSPHKLTGEVFAHLRELRAAQPDLSAVELARKTRHRFQTRLHPRTIEKALRSGAKRGRQPSS
jgi:transposase